MTLDELNKYITEEAKIVFGISSATDLYQLAFIVNRLDEGPILEIGTWLGRTAYAMAVNKNAKSILHLVDPFESNFTGGQPYPQANLDIYRNANPGNSN
jgi:predicted O-methyltransferase YrrM